MQGIGFGIHALGYCGPGRGYELQQSMRTATIAHTICQTYNALWSDLSLLASNNARGQGHFWHSLKPILPSARVISHGISDDHYRTASSCLWGRQQAFERLP